MVRISLTSLDRPRFARVFAALAILVALPLAPSRAVAADLTVVQIGPQTGPVAAIGKPFGEGARLAFDEANAKGGVAGNKINLVVKDDAYKPEETTKLAASLPLNEKPVALIGAVGVPNVLALFPVLEQLDVPLLGPVAGATSLRETNNKHVFHIRPTVRTEARSMTNHLLGVGINRIAVVYQDDPFGKDGLTGAEQRLQQADLKPVVAAGYERNTIKVEAAVSAVLAADPQAIVFIGQTPPAAALIKGLREKGNNTMVVTVASVNPQVLVSLLPAGMARGIGVAQVVPNPVELKFAIVRDYQAMIKKYGAKDMVPTHIGLEGYLAGKLLVEALQRTGRNHRYFCPACCEHGTQSEKRGAGTRARAVRQP
jgi:ABC-type branched-subunit amino acid transport system substrate-binding protein